VLDPPTSDFLFTQALLPALERSNRPDVPRVDLWTSLHKAAVSFYMAKHGRTAMASGLHLMFLSAPILSICIQSLWLKDISPADDD
jgi:hypothetical protein